MTDACTALPVTDRIRGPAHEFVHIENVGMTFETKRGPFVALRDIDLIVAQGEFVALIGHSGCGKSTLLNLVAGPPRADGRRPALRRPRDRGPGSRARRRVPEPFAAAVAHLLRQRAPRRRARVRRERVAAPT